MNTHRYLSRIRRIVIAASLAPLLAVAMTAHADRPMREAQTGHNPPIVVYPIDRGFAVHDPKEFGKADKWAVHYRYSVYHAEGKKSAEFMCANQPNRVGIDVRTWDDHDKHRKYGGGKLINGKDYTVMVDKHEPNVGTGAHNNNCVYYMTTVRPRAHGKAGVIVKNLDSGFIKAKHQLGDGWIRLQWQRPKGDVTGYNIYHTEGVIRELAGSGGNSAVKMCGEKPNRVSIGANATQHTIGGLKSDGTYTFLVAAHFRGRADGVNCGVVYHVGATVSGNKDSAPPRNMNPHNKHVSHLAGDRMVRINWKRARGPVAGYSIYYTPGKASPAALCASRANEIEINDRNAQQRDIDGLKNGETYSFLLKVKDTSGKVGPCPYLYHFTAKVGIPRITEMIHIHPGQAKLEQRKYWDLWIYYPTAKGATDYHLYYKRGKHTDAKKFCAERPNATPFMWARGGIELNGHFHDIRLQRETEYTFMVEAQFADRPPMRLRTTCHSVLFGHQTPTVQPGYD